MKIALAQMSMLPSQRENLAKSLAFIEQAQHSDLVLFPEIQLTPFFPQFRRHELLAKLGLNPQCLSISSDDAAIQAIKAACKAHQIMASPNFYVSMENALYDQSLLIGKQGDILGTAEMVHVLQAQQFYEQDYYTPSNKGFQVFATPFGKIGIVICFDRHLPESIRECALQGAALILVPTANTTAEPLELFEWELRIQAYQNNVFIASCNRVGREGQVNFAGESLVIDSEGKIVASAGGKEQLLEVEIDLKKSSDSRKKRPYLAIRRPEMYPESKKK